MVIIGSGALFALANDACNPMYADGNYMFY